MMNVDQGQAVRAQKAMTIAKQERIAKRGHLWVVPSQSHQGHYVVSNDVVNGMPTWECSCPDYATRGQPCKHVIAVEIVRHRSMPDGSTVTETLRVTYRQNWPAYEAAQVHEKEHFRLLLRDLCSGIVTVPHKAAGRPRMPLADVVFGCAMKVYSTVSGRRAMTDIEDCHKMDLIANVPDEKTLFRYMGNPALTPLLSDLITQTALPLRGVESCFAVDSTGFANSTYVRWFDEKYGSERSHKTWVKAHVMCGVKTHVITSAIITPMNGADCPQFKNLVEDTARHFNIVEVSADKAYLSRENVGLVDSLGAYPYIEFKDGTGEGTIGRDGRAAPFAKLWAKLFHAYQYDRENFLTHYHRRSNVESVFAMIKAKFGAAVRSTSPIAQMNEALVKILCHNIVVNVSAIYELGMTPILGPAAAGNLILQSGAA